MFPILYEQITAGTVPQHHGLGVLSDCLSCVVEQERNGIYELTMVYPITGIHAQDIAQRRVLKVKPNFTDVPQLFRIDRVGAVLNGTFTVYAKHISYDLSGCVITEGTAINSSGACELLKNAANECIGIEDAYNIDCPTKTVAGDFEITEPSSIRSWFAGKQGSFLDVYGTAELKYNNFHVEFMLHAGENRGVTIRYGKNLLELSQEIDSAALYTHVLCFYKGEDGIVKGNQVATGLTLDMPKILTLDVSQEFEEPPTSADLTDYATAYIQAHPSLTVPSNNITLDFVQSGELTNRVDLCDTVTIYYEALGITRSEVKCIRTKWDCLTEKYIETEFGDVKRTVTDTISSNNAIAADAKSSADAAQTAADAAIAAAEGKKRVFLTTPQPPYDEGDLWVNQGQIYVCKTARPAGYINYLGTTTTPLEDGSTTAVIVINGSSHTAVAGDVAVYDGTAYIMVRVEDSEHVYTNIWTEYETHIYIDWELATNYADKNDLDEAIKEATEAITGIAGGLVILHDTNNDGAPDEIIITNDNDFNKNTARLWRWNSGGLGYSKSGYDGPYSTAISINPQTGDGQINANFITTGKLNASLVTIENLTAAMFSGQEIVLGGANNREGKLTLKDENGTVVGVMNSSGLEFFGAVVNNIRPSVVFDKNGVTGYSNSNDKENTAIFWTKKEDFCMKNGIVENQLSIGNMLKFTPVTIRDNNSNILHQGIAVVPI